MVLASGPGVLPLSLSVDGVTANGMVIYSVSNEIREVPAAGGTSTTIFAQEGATVLGVAGNTVLIQRGNGSNLDYDASSGTTTKAPSKWQAAAPDGGLYLARSSGSTHLYEQTLTSGAVTDLGSVGDLDVYSTIESGPANAVVVNGNAAYFATYDAAGSVLKLDATGIPSNTYLSCPSVSNTGVACEYYRGNSDYVARLSFQGTAPEITKVANARYVAASDTLTAWSVGSTLYSQSEFGGTITSGHATGQVTSLAASPSSFYFDTLGSLAESGVYSATSSAAAQTRVTAAPAEPGTTTQIAVTSGRVAWGDNRRKGGQSLWSRSLSTDHGAITAGGLSLTASTATPEGLDLSGTRTAYVSTTSDSGYATARVVGGSVNRTIDGVIPLDPLNLSGNRLVWLGRSAHYRLENLVDGKVTDLTTKYGITHVEAEYAQVSLWGNYLTYAKQNGSVWRLDLSSTSKPEKLAGSGAQFVYSWGDWVTWGRYTKSGISGQIENVVTKKQHAMPRNEGPTGASSGGVIATGAGPGYRLLSWTGSTSHALPNSYAFDDGFGQVYDEGYGAPAVDGSTVAWIGADSRPRAAALGFAVADRPRALGLPDAPAQVRRKGTWHLDVPTSASLEHCAVVLRNGRHKVVRTLACVGSAAGQGDAVATWKVGATPRGTYTWTVVAKNGAGSLLAANGSSKPTSGTVRVG